MRLCIVELSLVEEDDVLLSQRVHYTPKRILVFTGIGGVERGNVFVEVFRTLPLLGESPI